MSPLQIRRLTPDCAQWNAALEYAQSHLNTALLVAGDMMPPLRDLALHAAAFESDRLVGVAVQFDGFATSSLSLAADRTDASSLLLRTFRPEHGLLAVSAEQSLPEWCAGLTWSDDPWLRGPCITDLEAESRSEAVVDAGELTKFYRSVHAPYWCPAMLESGRSRIIRDRDGSILAAGSVQFILTNQYAHMGALATAPGHGGQGFASTVLSALRSTLSRDGVRECGMFAEGAHPWLESFYERLGFSTVGQFRFAEMRSVQCLRT